ncbi:hypothetical protein [Aureimonas sp. Leaf324]|jgi:hypothetical protein|uniref:hypothetical protein n=1 Tax=Aureimonas sp. Leaf324 TaxID=1736336 RepID=UPI0006F27CE6|nr:hypothetical protein [Aureimonas sp. Leaf324]KQQ79028.1 hypothetical protein ASF65_14245 [Aureimonas sp. Leaf324]
MSFDEISAFLIHMFRIVVGLATVPALFFLTGVAVFALATGGGTEQDLQEAMQVSGISFALIGAILFGWVVFGLRGAKRVVSAVPCVGLFLFGLLGVISSDHTYFDRANPDYARIAEQLGQAVQRARQGATDADGLDLSTIHGGNWRTACLFGGYTYPSRTMQRLGARIDPQDMNRLARLRDRLGSLSEVEEFDAMVAYVTPDGGARFIHIEGAFGSMGQHFERCIEKPLTTIAL